MSDENAEPVAPARFIIPLRWVGVCALYFALTAFLFTADAIFGQPYWRWDGARIPLWVSCFSMCSIGLIAGVDMLLQWWLRRPEEYDFAYFPTIGGMRRIHTSVASRMVFAIGVILLATYFGITEFWLWELSHKAFGMAQCACRIFVIGLLLWCILWLADSLTRPRRAMAVVAVLYTLSALFLSLGLGLPGPRE